MAKEGTQLNFDPFAPGVMTGRRKPCHSCRTGLLIVTSPAADRRNILCDTCDFHEDWNAEGFMNPNDLTTETNQRTGFKPQQKTKYNPVTGKRYRPTTCVVCKAQLAAGSGRGLCSRHYQRWIKSGKPDIDLFIAAGAPMPDRWHELRNRAAAMATVGGAA